MDPVHDPCVDNMIARDREGRDEEGADDIKPVLCETCRVGLAKYRCPGCGRRSCNVQCVKQHKLEHSCSGVRCKTVFVPLNSFTDSHLFSDYYFLEEVERCIDSAYRGRTYFNSKQHQGYKKMRKFRWLCCEAAKREINLKLLPHGMLRHTTNTSFTVKNKSTKECDIHWRVHLFFPECNSSYQEQSVSEHTIVLELLERYIHPTLSDPIARHKLHSYVVGGVTGVEVWLEGKAQGEYELLDINSSLKDNLKHKTIIEFPSLHVVSKGAGPPIKKKEAGLPLGVKKEEEEGSGEGVVPSNSCPVAMEGRGKGVVASSDTEEGEIPASEDSVAMTTCTGLGLIAAQYSDSEDENT